MENEKAKKEVPAIKFTADEINTVLGYLQTRPWNEVNNLMVLLINKLKDKQTD